MRKDLLHAIANLASTQGYKKAKEAIEKRDKETDVDRYWAMRIAHIAASDGLAFKLPTMPLITRNNGTAELNLKRWLMRFWDITPTLTRITETTHMMTGLFIVMVEAVIEKAVQQLKRNVPILPT